LRQAGKTGKSVARSYISTLDLLVPVEASVSGVIGNNTANIADERLRVIRERYNKAMDYLKSPDDAPDANGRSKLATYVKKQEAWSKTVEAYSAAQDKALQTFKPSIAEGNTKPSTEDIKKAREQYMQWLQEHGRDVCILYIAVIYF
jgi:hypothetical protein